MVHPSQRMSRFLAAFFCSYIPPPLCGRGAGTDAPRGIYAVGLVAGIELPMKYDSGERAFRSTLPRTNSEIVRGMLG